MITLTIAIPTFNRKDSVLQRVAEIRNLIAGSENVDLLVSDNNSSDGTYEALVNRFGNEKKIRLFRNEENIKFHGNFLRLIEKADSEFLLISSDEDEVAVDGLEKLLVFLKEIKPSFVSTQFWIDRGKGPYLYRGSRKQERIRPKEFHASSFYISGLVFSVPLAKEYLANLRGRTDSCMGVYYYPHTLLAAHMIAEGGAYFAPFAVCEEKDNYSPIFQTPTGSRYNILNARWEQFKGILEYLTEAERVTRCKIKISRLRKMRIAHQKRLLDWLRWGVTIERPELSDTFDSSVASYIARHRLKHFLIPFAAKRQYPTRQDIARASTSSLTTWRLTKW